MSFPELLRQEDICKIEIPRLQRDYAQGRLDKSASEIREQLLFDIFTKESVSLNIIFGDSKNGVFIPVDGQQRLTTLFLLYLYEAKLVKENHIDFTKFAYATRKSTEDFIKELILEEHSWDEKLIKTDGKLSDYIKNQHWFVWPWYHDPTVLGMLVMLDAIHEKASQYAFPDLDKIEFDFLNMGEMGLNETLYLKMNSRGKHLSAFDKIKSGLDGLLENVQDITPRTYSTNVGECSFKEYWRYQMDREWVGWFWDKSDPLAQDMRFLSLIRDFAIAFYISHTDSITQNNNGEYIGDSVINSLNCNIEDLSWRNLLAVIEDTTDTNTPSINNEKRDTFFGMLFNLLERLKEGEGIFTSSWGYVINLKNIGTDTKQIAFLWGLVSYAGTSFNGEPNFSNWERFLWNMVYNTVSDFDSLTRFIRRCSNNYSQNSKKINIWLGSPKSNIGDNSDQWEEEREKAKYLKGDASPISKAILSAEKHPLLEGRIRPILLVDVDRIDAKTAPLRWEWFEKLFDENGAKANPAETFRIVFSYCNFWEALDYHYYVFQNSRTIWKDKLLSQKRYSYPILQLLNGKEMRPLEEISEIVQKTLCMPNVMEKVLEINNEWFYIRYPDHSLRPYGDMYNGIRLDQNNVRKAVSKLLKIEGLDFLKESDKSFYENSNENLVWGVRIKFSYLNSIVELWDNNNLLINDTWLLDSEENKINAVFFEGELKEVLDDYLQKQASTL